MAQTPNRVIKELWVVVADNGEPVGEGVVASFSPDAGWTPLITSEQSNVEKIKLLAKSAVMWNRTVLRKFVQVGEDEVIGEGS